MRARHLMVWLVFLALAASARSQELIDRVLAVAAGDLITLSDVRAALDFGLVDAGSAADPVRAALSRLIDRALILDEVNRYAPPEPAAAAIDDRVSQIRARFATAASYERALARSGYDERRLREIVREDLRIQSYLAQRFTGESPERSQAAIAEWVAGLRRRAEVVDRYDAAPGR
jgi:hypothetical protein